MNALAVGLDDWLVLRLTYYTNFDDLGFLKGSQGPWSEVRTPTGPLYMLATRFPGWAITDVVRAVYHTDIGEII